MVYHIILWEYNVLETHFTARDSSNEYTRLSQVIGKNVQTITQNGEWMSYKMSY